MYQCPSLDQEVPFVKGGSSLSGDFVANDVAVFLNPRDLGNTATFQNKDINIQFVDEYEAITLFGLEIENARPMAMAATTDITGIKHRDTLVINTITYYVVEIRNDGAGITTLLLSKD